MDFSQIPERIIQKRYEKGLTIKDLSESTGIQRDYLSRIENGKFKRCSPKTLQKISKALGVKTIWLLGIEEEKQTKKAKAS